MRRRNTFQPFSCYDRQGFIKQLRVVAEQDGEDLRCICWETSKMNVFHAIIGKAMVGENGRYALSESNPVNLALSFKVRAMEHGATAEAIRLMGTLLSLTKQEEAHMAEKLKSKGAPKAADKDALKASAKATPVAGKTAAAEPKKRGNIEALNKAREAGNAGREAFRAKKIKTLVKKADIKVRPDSARAQIINALFSSKTVGEYVDSDEKFAIGDVRWAEKQGYISVG